MSDEVKRSLDEENIKKGKSFLREAVILTVANFAVKIIGVIFKIPLTNELGDNIGVFTAAYSIYAMLFMLSTSGLPVAVSKLVAASNEKGRGAEAKRITLLATIVFGILGLLFTVALIIFAPNIAEFTNHTESALAMRVIAPSLFFICVCSSVRGHFQGLHNMNPTAISQFIEAFFKFAVGLGAVIYAGKLGASVEVRAACAISGVTVGSVLGTIFVILYGKFSKKSRVDTSNKECASDRELLKLILVVALPVTLTAATLYFSQFLDTVVIVKFLVNSGENVENAQKLFSAYTGLSVPIYDLFPSTLIYPIGTSILPAVAGALAVKKMRRAGQLTEQAIRVSALIAVPCGVFLLVGGKSCISLIYGIDNWSDILTMADGSRVSLIDSASVSLSILAVAMFFISTVSICNALLNAYGKAHLPLIAVSLGIVVLIVSEIGLLLSPMGIYGAPMSSLICYAVVLIIDFWFMKKYCGVRLRFFSLFGKPIICGGITAAATYCVYRGCVWFWQNFVGGSVYLRSASFAILMVTGVSMVSIYASTVLLLRAIKEDEVRLLPMGNRIASLLLKLNLIKSSDMDEE